MSTFDAINETIRLQGVALRTERDLDDAERHLRIARWRVRRLRNRLATERAAADESKLEARVAMGITR
jgi:uncharacterized protein YeeX (DUF496 family)